MMLLGCGIKNGEHRKLFGRFIAGGEETSPNEWPWMVFMHHARDAELSTNRQICGGALISPE